MEYIVETMPHPAQAGRLARVVIRGAAASDPVKKARLAVRRPSSVRGLAFGGFPSPGVMPVDTLHPYPNIRIEAILLLVPLAQRSTNLSR
jgi:hypothetical protein